MSLKFGTGGFDGLSNHATSPDALAHSMILLNPSPVLTDTLSPRGGERDRARGAFDFGSNAVES